MNYYHGLVSKRGEEERCATNMNGQVQSLSSSSLGSSSPILPSNFFFLSFDARLLAVEEEEEEEEEECENSDLRSSLFNFEGAEENRVIVVRSLARVTDEPNTQHSQHCTGG